MLVYKITNIVNGKIYIGQTSRTLEDRKRQHIRDAFTNNSQLLIHNAFRKYGIDNFRFDTICFCITKTEMDKKEMEMIALFNSKRPCGYNLTNGGEGSFGFRHSEETKTNLSNMRRGTKMSLEAIEKIRQAGIGRKMSDKCREALKVSNTGRKVSEKCKAASLLAHLGKKHTEETKEKMSAIRKINGSGKWNLGKKRTSEQRQRQSEAQKGGTPWNKGKKTPIEIRVKMSLGQFKQHQRKRNEKEEMIARMTGQDVESKEN